MTATWKTVRVFISSTFRDMQSERDWLVRFVFPMLRQELLQRRIHLVDVDLRWGVTSEQDALSVCREVVDECRPRFLCMLGGRYGWVTPGKTRSITADEVHYGVLDRDLKSRGFAYFYFRDPSATAAMVEVTPGEFRELAGSHGAVSLAELKTAIVEAGLQSFTYRADKWDDLSRRLIGLKEFGDRVYADLKQSIDQEFGPTTGEKPDEFTEENAAIEAFIEERVQRFVLGSRESVLNELLAHASSTGGNGYVCLTGVPGSGKSALLAHLARSLVARETRETDESKTAPEYPRLSASSAVKDAVLISHFVGASPGSTDVRRTLRRLCHELVAGAGLTAEIPEDPEKLRVAFAEILQQASAQKRVVILLDAINQFDPTTQLAGWSWLPEELPATARIFLSVISHQSSVTSDQSSVVSPVLESLRHRRFPPKEIELKPLTVEDSEAIIREFLHRYRKSMTDDQCTALLAKADAGSPLYLLVALEELRTLGTYEEITDRIAQLPPDTRALFIWILKRLEDDDGFRDASGRKTGRELVPRFVSLMGASRHGLSQQELVELLSPGDPQGHVAALAQLLRPYLMQRGELLDFYHGQFREAAATAYLPSESQRLAAHDQLATYFRDKADPERNQNWKGESPRPFLEVVFHLVDAQRIDDYCLTLCDLRFVEARCKAGQVFDLIADYRLAQEDLPEAQADLREERAREERVQRWTTEIVEYARQWSERRDLLARGESVTEPESVLPEIILSVNSWSTDRIEADCRCGINNHARLDSLRAFLGFASSYGHFLALHPDEVFTTALNQMGSSIVASVAKENQRRIVHPWLIRYVRPSKPPKEHFCRTFQGHTSDITCVDVTPHGSVAITGSKDKTLRVWDIESRHCIHVLKGHTDKIISVAMTPDARSAISGSEGGTARGWNLKDGREEYVFGGHTPWAHYVALTADGTVGISADGWKTIVWDFKNGGRRCTYNDRSGDFAMTAEGKTVVSMAKGDHEQLSLNATVIRGWDATSSRCYYRKPAEMLVWDLNSGQVQYRLQAQCLYFNRIAISPNGRRVYSTCGDGDTGLRIWDLDRGTCRILPETVGRYIWSFAVTPDGRTAIAVDNRCLEMWDLEEERSLSRVQTVESLFNSIAMTPDARMLIASGSPDLRVWNLEALKEATEVVTQQRRSSAVVLMPGARTAIAMHHDGLSLWDMESGQKTTEMEGMIHCAAVDPSPDGNYIIVGSASIKGYLWLCDLRHGSCAHYSLESTSHAPSAAIHSVVVTPNSKTAVAGSVDGTIRVLSMSTAKELQCLNDSGQKWLGLLKSHTGMGPVLAVTPDGKTVVAANYKTALKTWQLDSGIKWGARKGKVPKTMCVAITPDSKAAITGHQEGTIHIWNLKTKCCQRFDGNGKSSISIIALTPDGARAVTADAESTLCVWNLRSRMNLGRMSGHSRHHHISAIQITPDGRTAFSASGDATVRIWNLESGVCLGVY